MLINKLSRKVIVPAMVTALLVGTAATASAATVCNNTNANNVVSNLSKTNLESLIKDNNAQLTTIPLNNSSKSNTCNIVKSGNGYQITLGNLNPTITPAEETTEVETAKPEKVTENKVEAPSQPAAPSKPVEEPALEQPKEQAKQPETNTQGLSAEEAQMVELVNQARAQAGVKPLTVDVSLANVARIKSKDMHDNKYFSHTSPTYGSPFDMMRDFGIQYRAAGENIAKNYSVQDAHTSLMNSEGHRNNILNPNFTHIGIGIYNGYYTQMFITK
ncbi:CAP domain-containing protein [Alkaliphilus crotonatoxidans]